MALLLRLVVDLLNFNFSINGSADKIGDSMGIVSEARHGIGLVGMAPRLQLKL